MTNLEKAKERCYDLIDKIREQVRLERSRRLRQLAIVKKIKQRKETQFISLSLEKRIYDKLKQESIDSGISIQDIVRSVLMKRYKILKRKN